MLVSRLIEALGITHLIPKHILVPRENVTMYFSSCLENVWSSQRSGENFSGSGKLVLSRLMSMGGMLMEVCVVY